MNEYVERFLNLDCATDVINAVIPRGHFVLNAKLEREISEAWAMIKVVRPFALTHPHPVLCDVGSSSIFFAVLAAHLFPFTHVFSIGEKVLRMGVRRPVNSFTYYHVDSISSFNLHEFVEEGGINLITTVHPTVNNSYEIGLNIFNTHAYPIAGAIMPRTVEQSPFKLEPKILAEKLGPYLTYCFFLREYSLLKKMQVDKNIMSEGNIILSTAMEG